jgi:hypothetical protein
MRIYPNPGKSADLINIRTNSDGYLYIYNTLGQLLEIPLRINGYTVGQFEIGHLPSGLYILKFIDPEGRSASRRYVRY